MRRRVIIGISGVIICFIAVYYLANARTFQLVGTLIHRVPTSEKVVALTFDDGPQPGFTEQILATLDDVDVKATFFVTGAELEQHMDQGKQVVAAGHALGNHSYSHRRMVFVSPSFVRNEIERTDQLIREAGYSGEIYFRPPYSKKLVVLPAYLARANRATIMCNIEPESYNEIAQDSTRITEHVVQQAQPGSIILLHVMYPSRQPSQDAVRDIVLQLKDAGYRFVTIPELLKLQQD